VIAIDGSSEISVRCAPWTREHEIDPIGSIGSFGSYLLLEWPLPWPSDFNSIPELQHLSPMLKTANCRLQGLVPEGYRFQRTVTLYRGVPDGHFRHYLRNRVTVDPIDVLASAEHLLNTTDSGSEEDETVDVLVCTHGRRDRCCGSMGTTLAKELQADSDFLGSQTSVWRTSHTGGHRFAPTALVFPEGTGWAFADKEILGRVVERSGSIADVLPHYRGCAGLGSARIQALERAVLGEIGWDLFHMGRRGVEGADGRVQLFVVDGKVTSVW
jgi:hypothetical protein